MAALRKVALHATMSKAALAVHLLIYLNNISIIDHYTPPHYLCFSKPNMMRWDGKVWWISPASHAIDLSHYADVNRKILNKFVCTKALV